MRLLRNAQRQHAVFQAGVDARGVELPAQRERAAITRHAHLGVHRLQPFGRQRAHAAFDRQRIALDLELELLARHAGHVGQQRDARLVFVHVHRREHGALRRLLLGCHVGLSVGHEISPCRARVTAR